MQVFLRHDIPLLSSKTGGVYGGDLIESDCALQSFKKFDWNGSISKMGA